MGKKDKCCDRYKKKDEYCRGCPIVDSCELAPRPPDAEETGKKKGARKDKKEKKDKKNKKSKKHRKAEKA